MYAYMHDQTLRLMNQGYVGSEIAEMLELGATVTPQLFVTDTLGDPDQAFERGLLAGLAGAAQRIEAADAVHLPRLARIVPAHEIARSAARICSAAVSGCCTGVP